MFVVLFRDDNAILAPFLVLFFFFFKMYIVVPIAVPFRSFITKVIEMQILFWSPFKLDRYSQDKITVIFKGLFRHTTLLHTSYL